MVQPNIARKVTDPHRLATLKEFNLLDSPVEESFDRLTRLASKILDTPISLITLIDADRQFFKSLWGIPEPLATERETPLSHSICQHVVANNEPLIVNDTRQHPYLKDNLAVPNFNVIAYLGMPLTTTNGIGLGSFCVIDTKPRAWSEQEIEIVRELALSTMSEIELRMDRDIQNKARDEAEQELVKRNNQYRRVYRFASSTIEHMTTVIEKGGDPAEILVYLQDMERQLSRL
jgi:GAF domain-containing protein